MEPTQERLLDAAGQVFAEKGYESATVREICRRAGVQNIAAVNYYFGDKERLYSVVVKKAFHADADRGAPDWPEGLGPVEKLRRFVKGFVEGLIGTHRPDWHFQVMARELAHPSHGGEAFVRDFARPQFDVLLGLVRQLAPEASPRKQRLIATSIIGQCVHHRCGRNIIGMLVGEDELACYSAELLAEHIADFSLRALGIVPADAAPPAAAASRL